MKLLQLNVENFRNIPFASLSLEERSIFLLGQNGQGKSNLLEGIGLMTAARSFRTQDTRNMILHGGSLARLFFRIEHEKLGTAEVTLSLSTTGKEIQMNGEKVSRLADFIGLFPSVVLSSEDIQMLRGGPQLRRRFLDLILSATDKAYFDALRQYHRALRDRNKLLRADGQNASMLDAFEKTMAPLAVTLLDKRRSLIDELGKVLIEKYTAISPSEEEPELLLKSDSQVESVDDYLGIWYESRERDRILKSTQRGPHRDDLIFRLKKKGARDFASDGQQRGFIVALRLAQIAYFQQLSEVAPVVLADDILGELDPVRREGVWRIIGDELQVIATGTAEPEQVSSRSWHYISVKDGTFSPSSKSEIND